MRSQHMRAKLRRFLADDPADKRGVDRRPIVERADRQSAVMQEGGLGLHLQKLPKGVWGFKGQVPAELAWERVDGKPLSKDDVATIAELVNYHVPRKTLMWAPYRLRTFKDAEAAMKAAAEAGVEKDVVREEGVDAEGSTPPSGGEGRERPRRQLDEQLSGRSLFAFDKGADVELVYFFDDGHLEIGMGGEWWGGRGPLKVGVQVYHHRKEAADEAYKPVSVGCEKKGDALEITVMGGFLGQPYAELVGGKFEPRKPKTDRARFVLKLEVA